MEVIFSDVLKLEINVDVRMLKVRNRWRLNLHLHRQILGVGHQMLQTLQLRLASV